MAALLLATFAADLGAQDAGRPMTFMDMQSMKTFGSPTPSPDGRALLYTVSFPDWKEAKRQTDGGEARKVTDAKDGVSGYALTRDGRSVIYLAGKEGERQLYRLPVAGIDSAQPEPLTKQAAGVGQWQITKDSRRIYFITADTVDAEEKERREKKFTVEVRNAETPRSSLWALELLPVSVTRLTNDSAITVSSITVSDDGRWVSFRGTSANRYQRNITEAGINADTYLLETATGTIERITHNQEVGESNLSFSPDGRWAAFSAPDDLEKYSMKNQRVYLRAVADRGGEWRSWARRSTAMPASPSGHPTRKRSTSTRGCGPPTRFALDIASGAVTQVTDVPAWVFVTRNDDTGTLFVNYSDPRTPATLYTVASAEELGNRRAWRQLTDVNPQVRALALGAEEEIFWTSTDGSRVAVSW